MNHGFERKIQKQVYNISNGYDLLHLKQGPEEYLYATE